MSMIDIGDSMTDAFDFLDSFSGSDSLASSFAYEEREDFAAFLSSDVNSTTVIQAFSTASGPPTRTFDANQTKPKTKNKKKRKPAQIFQENSDCLVPARIPLPRVLKSDIRRQYGTMFANVFNTGEYDFMWNFLDTFVRPDDLYIMRKVGIPDPIVTIVGKPKLAEYWYQRMHDAPDLLFSIDKSKLKIRSDGTAVFSTRFSIKGTIVIGNEEQQKMFDSKVADTPCTGQVYGTEVEDIHDVNNISDSMSVSDTSSINGIDVDIVDALLDDPIQKITKEVNGDQAVTNFEPKIIDYLVAGVISMHLDSDCRLGLLEMIIDNNEQKEIHWKPPVQDKPPIVTNIEF